MSGDDVASVSPDWLNRAKVFWLFVAGLTCFRLLYISVAPLTPQEAYYWYYSQKLDLSYFDHPPVTAYSIWMGTRLFGDTIFGIKVMGVLWSALTNAVLYWVSLNVAARDRVGSSHHSPRRTAFLVVIVYNMTLFAHVYAVTFTPDTPLLLCWLLVIGLWLEAMERDRARWWVLAGAALGLGLASKYTAIALVPAIVTVPVVESQYRHHLRKPGPYLAVLAAVLVFMPVICWNATHEWASFAFQFQNRVRRAQSLRVDYLGQLLVSQLVLLTPLVFGLIVAMAKQVVNRWRDHPTCRVLFLTGAFIVVGFIAVSLTSLVKMNWLLPGYTGFIMAAALMHERTILAWGRWVKIGVCVSVLLIVIGHGLWVVPNVPLGEANTWSGWAEAAARVAVLQRERGGREKCFVFSNSYKGASLLKFYLPEHQDVYAENIYGRPALQFDFWPVPASLIGDDALYVISDRKEYKAELDKVSAYFDEVVLLEAFDTRFVDGITTRRISCYLARNYKGSRRAPAPVIRGALDGLCGPISSAHAPRLG